VSRHINILLMTCRGRRWPNGQYNTVHLKITGVYVPVKCTLYEKLADTNHASFFHDSGIIGGEQVYLFLATYSVDKTLFLRSSFVQNVPEVLCYPALCYKVCFIIHHAIFAVDTCLLVCWNWGSLVSSSFHT